jgi:polyketide synthase 13
MGKELCALSPRFAARVAEIAEVIRAESGWDLLTLIDDDAQNFDLESAQVGITAIQIALTDFMKSLGAKPAAVVGQSMGEIAAAYAVGGLSMADAVRIACHRARLMGEGERLLPEDKRGAMAVIDLGVEELTQFEADHPEFAAVEPAVYAAPGMTTVGGPAAQVDALVAHFEEEGRFARKMQVKGAGHTSMLDPILGELHAEICTVEAHPIHTPLYSTVDKGVVYRPGDAPHDADYFVRCTRQPVWFEAATAAQFEAGFRTFVEFSPNPVALMPMMNTAFANNAGDSSLMFLLKRKEPSADTLLATVSELYVRGADIDFAELSDVPGLSGAKRYAEVPGVHWNLHRHWTGARPGGGAVRGMPGAKVSLPDGRTAFSVPVSEVTSIAALAEAAVSSVVAGAQVSATETYGALTGGAGDEITTIIQRTLGGLNVQIYAVTNDTTGGASTLVGEAFAPTTGGSSAAAGAAAALTASAVETTSPAAAAAQHANTAAAHALPTVDTDAVRWNPESGQSVADRLKEIVSESMGYDVDDLPGELPLIDLGLDSLMGMRIKNRVEYDFDLPPLNVQELRDGSVDSVIAMVEAQVAAKATGETAEAAEAPAETAEAPAEASSEEKDAEPQGVGVAPRDAAERMVFGTWASLTGVAPAGVTSPLNSIDEATARKIADRINERSGSEITVAQVLEADSVEPLSDIARESLETEVEGNIRVLRERPEGSRRPAVFMFHPAGGSSVVYEPLTRRLPADVPVYGVERLEGTLDERAEAYVADITRLADGLPVVLGGWSFGGALAYEVAHRLEKTDVTVGHLELLDLVQPLHPAPDTKEEMHARWDRYSAFAAKTYGIALPVPHDLLEEQGEEALIGMMTMFLQNTDASEHGLAAGVLEHQRASFVDTRILNTLDFHRWADVTAPVTLYKSEGMHEGAIELEPSFAEIAPDGGWGGIVDDLEIVQLAGDHLGVPDEPAIGIVGAGIVEHLDEITAALG